MRGDGGSVPLEWADVERKTEKQWDVRKGRWRADVERKTEKQWDVRKGRWRGKKK